MNHDVLIDLIHRLGYPIDKNGMCYGIAAMGMQAILAGEVEVFKNRLKAMEAVINPKPDITKILAEFSDTSALTRQVDAILKPTKEFNTEKLAKTILEIEAKRIKKEKLTEAENRLADVRAFIEGIVLYFQPQLFPDLFPKEATPSTQNITLTLSRGLPAKLVEIKDMKLQKGENIPELQELKVRQLDSKEFIGVYTKDTLTDYFKQLHSEFTPPLAFILHSCDHAITAAYDNEKHVWQLIDANQLPIKEFKTDKDMAEAVLNAFSENGYAIIRAEVFCHSAQFEKAKEWLHKVTSSENFKEIHKKQEENHAITDSTGGSLIYAAVKAGHSNLVEKLLKSKASPNQKYKDVTLLSKAAENGCLDMIGKLIEGKADVNQVSKTAFTPLYVAAQHKQNDVIKKLIEAKSDVNYTNKENGFTLLHYAVDFNEANVIKTLIYEKADVNRVSEDGHTALDIAFRRNNGNVIKNLIAAKADTSYETYNLIKSKGIDGIKKILEHKLDVNQVINMSSKYLLIEAQKFDRSDKLKALLHKKNISYKTEIVENYTSLHDAVLCNRLDVVKGLIEAKANIHQKAGNKISCFDLAEAMGHKEMIKLLKDAQSQALPKKGLAQKFRNYFRKSSPSQQKDQKTISNKQIKGKS